MKINKKISICGIVKDIDRQILNNIKNIELLRSSFVESEIIIYENNSIDNTKAVIKNWAMQTTNLKIISEDLDLIGENNNSCNIVNPFFSEKRIQKLCNARNKYLDFLNQNNFNSDYILVIDLDIPIINIEGILQSFEIKQNWDCIASNSYFYNKYLKRIYYDTYALIELGQENIPQTEELIFDMQLRFACLKPEMPLFPVYSAFGGICIYRREILFDAKYTCIKNNDSKVEVRCEHVGLNSFLHQKGFNRIFINPKLRFPYKKVFDMNNIKLLLKYLR